jgi:hypothetical protein
MSRIALIYPKLAIFRSRTQLTSSASTARNCDLMKNPSFNTQLNVVLMSLNNIQLTQVNTFSSNSVSNPGVQTASTLIQKDLFELASKALLELQESKNSSSLVVEVNFQFFMFYCFSCFLVLFLLSYKTNILLFFYRKKRMFSVIYIEHCSIPKKV